MHYIKIPDKSKKSLKKKLLISVLVVAIFIISWFILSTKFNQVVSPLNLILKQGWNINSTDDRVNILLLGNGGGLHAGGLLTDTVIVASLNFKTKQVYLISIPRDMWVVETSSKVNAIYEKGGAGGDGLEISKKVIGNVLGIPIHYAFRIDFSGFTKAIDEIGGIDVNIEHSFDDYLYPVTGKEDDMCGYTEQEKDYTQEEAKTLNLQPGKQKVLISPMGEIATDSAEEDKGFKYFSCRYEHLSFKSGATHLDGITALKFVRSRHGSNAEGSDFARSRRQQLVIEAAKSKILSFEILVNPSKLTALIRIFGNSFETDLQINEIIELYKLAKKNTATSTVVLSNEGKNPLLVNPPIGKYGAWVLTPRDDNYNEIHSYVKRLLSREGASNESSSSARTGGN